MNERDDVVGVSCEGEKRAVLGLAKGPPSDLGTLPRFSYREAVSISDRGDSAGFVTGTAESPSVTRAVFWPPGGLSIRDLGALPGGSDSRARDLNNSGSVVGTSTSEHGSRAFIWTESSGMVDLNTLISVPGLVLTDAVGINDQGDIVAVGFDGDSRAPEHEHGEHDHERPRRVVVLSEIR